MKAYYEELRIDDLTFAGEEPSNESIAALRSKQWPDITTLAGEDSTLLAAVAKAYHYDFFSLLFGGGRSVEKVVYFIDSCDDVAVEEDRLLFTGSVVEIGGEGKHIQ